MKNIPTPTRFFSPLLCALLLCSMFVSSQEAMPVQDGFDDLAYKYAIKQLESEQGAYAPGLAETLLDLARALQSQGRHAEAISEFKRAGHLARINDGLYSAQQVPMLQGEIISHIAKEDYPLADERQRYLYRVQLRAMENGIPMAPALLQQARWQFDAYQLRLDGQGYSRLMNMWDMYRLALNDIIEREGETSPNLLPPLYGMLQAQYLISSYDWQAEERGFDDDDIRARQSLQRFNAYRAESYKKGSAVIAAMRDIEQGSIEADLAVAQNLVMLGDWRLWHGDRDGAWQAYGEAEMELAQRDDAQLQVDSLFGAPVPLPDIGGLRPLPPETDTEQPDILLVFGITDRGRVTGLERLGDSEDLDAQARYLMKTLRKTQFRPRFKAGQPLETEKIVKAFNID